MADHDAEHAVLKHIDQSELGDLGKSLVHLPRFTGEETPVPAGWRVIWRHEATR